MQLHAFSMLGIAPLLMELRYEFSMHRYILPSSSFPLKSLGLILPSTFLLRFMTWSTNSGLSSSMSRVSRSWSFFSSTRGLTRVMQSLSLKKEVRSLLILFFSSMSSENPFCGARERSKQSLEVMESPSELISMREKSLTIQQKAGKQLARSSGSSSSSSELLELSWMFFVRFTTRLRFCSAFSSMDPVELQMKELAARMARVKIRVSWVWSSSKAPIPSVSMMITFTESPSGVLPMMGLPQHHSPFVQGLVDGPTPKPLLRLSSIRLSRQDLPVLYMPATEMTAMGGLIWLMKAAPSGLMTYSGLSSTVTSACIHLNQLDSLFNLGFLHLYLILNIKRSRILKSITKTKTPPTPQNIPPSPTRPRLPVGKLQTLLKY